MAQIVKSCETCGYYELYKRDCYCVDHEDWFAKTNTKEDTKMNVNNIMAVHVQFPSSCKNYVYLTDLKLAVGDQVIVDTSNNGAVVATVSAVDVNVNVATRWVVSKVDLTEHRKRVVKLAKLAALRERLEARRAQLEDVTVYAQLAEKDCEMARLWHEFCELTRS